MKYIKLATLGIGVHYDSTSLYKGYTYAGDQTRVLPCRAWLGAVWAGAFRSVPTHCPRTTTARRVGWYPVVPPARK